MHASKIASVVLLSLLAFCLQSEIDHHDGVLFYDSDQQHNANDGDDVQILLKEHQCEHRAYARRRQRGDDRQGMDQAFIQNAENDVDRQQRRQNQQGLGAQRLLVGQQRAGKKALQRGRRAQPLLHLADGQCGIAQRYVRREVKGHGDRGE